MKANLTLQTHDVRIDGRLFGAGIAWASNNKPGRRLQLVHAVARAGARVCVGPARDCQEWLIGHGLTPREAADLLTIGQDRVRSDLLRQLYPSWN